MPMVPSTLARVSTVPLAAAARRAGAFAPVAISTSPVVVMSDWILDWYAGRVPPAFMPSASSAEPFASRARVFAPEA